jgi:DNA invertase Pin-like site-specific DNA recombinase
MLIGYCRVSGEGQNLDLQKDALVRAGCARIYEDQLSGGTSDRPGLKQALDQCRDGDTLLVWKLCRLGRSLKHIIETIDVLNKKGVSFRSLTEGFDTRTSTGRATMYIFGTLAEMEREWNRERTIAGLRAARQRNRFGGRRPIMTAAKIEAAKKLLAEQTPAKEVARVIGVSLATIYRYCPGGVKTVEPVVVEAAQ